MRVGVRGHDVAAHNPRDLCEKLLGLGVQEIQLVAHKSFPDFQYNEKTVKELASVFEECGIHVAIYGCYIDPLTHDGQQRFLEHIRYANILGAGAIATESAVGITNLQEDEKTYEALVPVFRFFAEEGKKQGVRVAVETVYVHPICTVEKTRKLLHDVQSTNLYVILDPVNLMQTQDDPQLKQHVQDAVRSYGDRILAVHWKEDQFDPSDFAEVLDHAVIITEGITGTKLEQIVQTINKES